MDVTHTEPYKGYTIKIVQDPDPINPRHDYDHVGTMVCFHKRYDLGDKDHGINHDDFNSWMDMKEHIEKEHDVELILPLYLYDHSGLRIKIGSFEGLLPGGHAQFDSGPVGFIFCSKAKAKDEAVPDLQKCFEGEVEEYDAYLRGAVYGYTITKPDGEDIDEDDDALDEDSCWGFICDHDGYVLEEARRVVDYKVKEELKRCGEQQELALNGEDA